MVRCPRCGGAGMASPLFTMVEEIELCSRCRAELTTGGQSDEVPLSSPRARIDLAAKRRSRYQIEGYERDQYSYLNETGDVLLSEEEAQRKWRRDHPEYYVPIARCDHCNAAITIPSARFCPNCGWNLLAPIKETVPLRSKARSSMRNRVATFSWRKEKCMVCNLTFERKDNVVCCPHCGQLAHRNHLVSWISKRRACPVCGQYLDEREYE